MATLDLAVRSGSTPSILVDRAAVGLLLAAAQDDPRRLSQALADVDRALTHQPGYQAALFNRALVLEQLGLIQAARQAWRRYLSREDPASPWAEEARDHLQKLTLTERFEASMAQRSGRPDPAEFSQLVTAFPTRLREWGITVLLGRWGEHWKAGKPEEAKESLVRARQLGEALLAVRGEDLLLAAVEAVERSMVRGTDAEIGALADAHAHLGPALTALRQGRPERAEERLAACLLPLRRGGSPLSFWAAFYRGASLYNQGQYAAARSVLAELRADPAMARQAFLTGEIRMMLGLIANNTDNAETGLLELAAARDIFRVTGDLGEEATAEAWLGESYDILGDRQRAWEHFFRALTLHGRAGDRYRGVQIFNAMADLTLRHGEIELSLAYQDAAVSASRRLDNPPFAADVVLWRALLNARLGHAEAARRDLRLAAEAGSRIAGSGPRARFQADLGLVAGTNALITGNPRDALAPLSRAIFHAEEQGHQPNLLLSYEARAQAFRQLGDVRNERLDLDRSLEIYGRIGHHLEDDGVRLPFAGLIESAFDQRLRAEVDEGKNPASSVQLAERAKAMSYPVRPEGRWITQPVPLTATRRALPPKGVLVEYTLLSDRLLIWVVTPDSPQVTPHQVPIAAASVKGQIDRLVGEGWGDAAWRQAQAELYDLLLGSWFEPERFSTLVVVPDKELFALPWGILRDRHRGKLLIEQAAIVVTPGMALFTRAQERDRRLAADPRQGKLLVVANPDFDTDSFNLEPLPAAAREAEEIRRLFPAETTLLEGPAATGEAFLRAAPGAGRIHFAGHAVASPDRPLDSYLVLAPSAKRRGRVSGTELQELALPVTRLVTLSACGTLAAPRTAWPGAISLARPFLTAGVPAVVGSLWTVRDHASRPLMVRFYVALRRGENPPTALREAQLQIFYESGGELPRQGWPAFQVVGGPWLTRPKESVH